MNSIFKLSKNLPQKPGFLLILVLCNFGFHLCCIKLAQLCSSFLPYFVLIIWNLWATLLYLNWITHHLLRLNATSNQKKIAYLFSLMPYLSFPLLFLMLASQHYHQLRLWHRYFTLTIFFSLLVPLLIPARSVPFGLHPKEYQLIQHLPPLLNYAWVSVRQYQAVSALTTDEVITHTWAYHQQHILRQKLLQHPTYPLSFTQKHSLSFKNFPLGMCYVRGNIGWSINQALKSFF